MAKYPGMEGDQIHPVNKNIIKGRWLIVEMANGDIQTRHYSEAVLNHLFVEADLKLADYTEDVPASAQEKYESILYGGRQEKSVKDRLLG
jgi:hypothetical protein